MVLDPHNWRRLESFGLGPQDVLSWWEEIHLISTQQFGLNSVTASRLANGAIAEFFTPTDGLECHNPVCWALIYTLLIQDHDEENARIRIRTRLLSHLKTCRACGKKLERLTAYAAEFLATWSHTQTELIC